MPTRGTKRKFPEWEETTLDDYLSSQIETYSLRQSLLNISLQKFNKGRSMIEPSLRRYVLISNTLKVIQEEIRHENDPCDIPNYEEDMSDACDALSGNVASPVLHQDLENANLPSEEDDHNVNAAIASILKELENVLDESNSHSVQSSNDVASTHTSIVQPPSDEGATVKEQVFGSDPESYSEIDYLSELVMAASCAEAHEPMDTSQAEQVPSDVPELSGAGGIHSSEVVNFLAPAMQSFPSVSPEELTGLEVIFGSFEIMDSDYFNDLTFDDPFTDIDTSVFEREVPVAAPSSSGAAPSSRLSSSEESWFSYSYNSPSYSSSQGLREPNDLENILEILVGSC